MTATRVRGLGVGVGGLKASAGTVGCDGAAAAVGQAMRRPCWVGLAEVRRDSRRKMQERYGQKEIRVSGGHSANRLQELCVRNGNIYIKLGQHIAQLVQHDHLVDTSVIDITTVDLVVNSLHYIFPNFDYRVLFELIWRDYFRFHPAKYGNSIFLLVNFTYLHKHDMTCYCLFSKTKAKTAVADMLTKSREDRSADDGNGLYRPYMVIALPSTLSNWLNDSMRFAPSLNGLIYHGDKVARTELTRNYMPKTVGPGFPIIITSYLMAMFDAKFLANYKWKSHDLNYCPYGTSQKHTVVVALSYSDVHSLAPGIGLGRRGEEEGAGDTVEGRRDGGERKSMREMEMYYVNIQKESFDKIADVVLFEGA
ncbi:ATP-dependent DNA helicase DDM1 [Triticum urartu]|uniref:ATP-dependent DNA helicase DDM1 n=1 Tax=Triticum urartu TaxID=4572 RepID=M7ZRT1_TRIUA|nr:ATP-dependent DNA helicase DDM1 [Triticum urartu]